MVGPGLPESIRISRRSPRLGIAPDSKSMPPMEFNSTDGAPRGKPSVLFKVTVGYQFELNE